MGGGGASVTARAAAKAEVTKVAAAGDLLTTARKAAEAAEAAALSKAAISSAAVSAAGGVIGAVTDQRKLLLSDASVVAATQKLEALGYPVKVGGRWPSGLPYLDLEIKATTASWGTGLQLPLTIVNISALQVRLANNLDRGVGRVVVLRPPRGRGTACWRRVPQRPARADSPPWSSSHDRRLYAPDPPCKRCLRWRCSLVEVEAWSVAPLPLQALARAMPPR